METDRSSSIDEFMTDKNDGPMEHDGFGGGESIGAIGGVKRWAEPSDGHASHELRHDRVEVGELGHDRVYVSDWR